MTTTAERLRSYGSQTEVNHHDQKGGLDLRWIGVFNFGLEIGTLDATTCRHVGRSAGRPGGARVVSGAEKKII